jgi:hypothetical protein
MDVAYTAARGAEITRSGSMVYTLTADPQDLVTPETLHVNVTWPSGYRTTGPLPEGWRATAHGATYTGTMSLQTTWEIPLSKG